MKRRTIALLVACAGIAVLTPAVAEAADAPAWSTPGLFASPTKLAPSTSPYAPDDTYFFTFHNVGAASTSGAVTITDTLAPGLSATSAKVVSGSIRGTTEGSCVIGSPNPQDVTCTVSVPVGVVEKVSGAIHIDPGSLSEGTVVDNQLTVSGGGAPAAAMSTSTEISSVPPAFDFLPGLNGLAATATDSEGQNATEAGSHPGQLAIELAFPLQSANVIGDPHLPPSGTAVADGGVRDILTYLPAGMVVNPQAVPRCSEAELESYTCPDNTVVGAANLYSTITLGYGEDNAPLYNIEPPPGAAAAFSFNAVGADIFPHILGGVRAGDYALGARSQAILERSDTPFQGIRIKFWGNPSNPIYDHWRGGCLSALGGTAAACPVTPSSAPLLSTPTSCSDSISIEASIDSWGHPGEFIERAEPLTDGAGNPTPVTGCAALGAGFQPTLEARPTTNVADSPSGLDVDLAIPQTNDLNELATAHLKKAVVTLPPGLVLNPSSANGLGSCSSAQIGIDPNTGIANGDPIACPDSSRIGTVEVDTPLLDHPTPGAVYIATPHDNPFDSLLAIYVVIDDPVSGTLVKLAGHVAPDPSTGQLTTTFDHNPQLPFDHFKLHFKSGPRAVLRTPSTCGNYSTTSEMTPWSAPDSGPPATPHDDYAISQGPGGGCASSESSLPNSPSFDAGAVSPIAAKSTPFVLHLRREDGSQNFSAVDVSPPPGLTAKLAGTEQCSDAALAAAAAKSGHQEQQSPSCPASSEVGSFQAAAGSGPSPYYAPGKVYLSGPYKGAPLSLAFITPAVAGPYDLGTIVTRAAVRIDASTGRVTTVSDPLPRILRGIPLDVRSVDVSLDRPDFARTGTSCDPLSVDGSLTSTLGQVVPLSQRFQLAECTGLAFKPKLGIRLFGGTKRGSHPALRGVVQMPEGGANIAKTIVALPHSEFLDQGHIGTVCTRVQFAAGDGNGSACPAASIYGHATATSPLVSYALEGNAILRSSSHELPDLVVALHGPPSQPIAVDVVGRIDSVKGGIRTSFEGVPDLPVSSFVLSMQGGKKGLLQNSTNICKGVHKVTAEFDAQNGKTADLSPALKNGKCGKTKTKNKKGNHRKHKRAARR
jgi:hypothetical protein